ncbi:hypothetical protein niasHT_021905 [Heterodera trifolii]|uniref:Uncharacterized protein n=1 Tax=Heterodera trifolii TaxID=157864 RepID=A0ABD2K9G3_9BILA
MAHKLDYIHETLDEQNKRLNERENCNAKEKCKHCGGVFLCVPVVETWMQFTGCCRPGHLMECCRTTTSTTTTTTTTTTTITTTTTTDEFLRCKKATFESNPAGNIYNEQEDKACSLAERHCYVLNCTTSQYFCPYN